MVIYMYHTKKIGVFISHIFGVYQQGVCQGIIDKALEYGYTSEIFSSLDGENLGTYAKGEESILRIPNFDNFDGIIFASDTYISEELKQQILSTLTSLSCPVVEISVANYHFPSVSLENNSTARELTEHLISVHNASRICYLGCSSEAYFSDARENYYKEALKKYGREPGPNDIFSCSYDTDEVQRALSFFCEPGTPDAVVCYNDQLALLFLSAALEAGLRVPEDIALTGCDDSLAGRNASPMLTTVSFPIYELGVMAVENLLKKIRGENLPESTRLRAKPIFNNSCGCHSAQKTNPIFFTQGLSSRITTLENSILDSMNMSAALSHVNDIDEGMDLLEQYVRKIEKCKEFYLCLYSDWNAVSSHILALTDSEEAPTDTDTIMLKLAIRDGKRLPECSYRKKNLLPEYLYDSSENAHVYIPLFFEEKAFGYIALAYENNQIDYHFRLVQWQININQMLQNICDSKRTGLLISRLEEIYMKDSLTGLYNKHGYNHFEDSLLQHAVSHELSLTAFMIDMDGLKIINDTYGHNEGDFAIQVLGHALESCLNEGDLCARFSGDEFYILAVGLSPDDMKLRIQSIYNYLDHYNNLSQKPYNVCCSCGYSYMMPDASVTSEKIRELFAQADSNMYEKKIRHHAVRT